jgi:Flp pilus assembly protein TadD
MLEDAAKVLEKVTAEDETHNEVLGVRLDLCMAAKKWDLAAKVGRRLVKNEPGNAGAWVNLAYSIRRVEGLDSAEEILLHACSLHPNNALIAYNLSCYASVAGRTEEAKIRLRHAFDLNKAFRGVALADC